MDEVAKANRAAAEDARRRKDALAKAQVSQTAARTVPRYSFPRSELLAFFTKRKKKDCLS